MVDRYDAATGCAELKVRSRVISAVRQGWRTAEPHTAPQREPKRARLEQLPPTPMPLTPAPATPAALPVQDVPTGNWSYVIHSSHGKLHRWWKGEKTECGRFKCGTPLAPSEFATFFGKKPDFSACGHCSVGL